MRSASNWRGSRCRGGKKRKEYSENAAHEALINQAQFKVPLPSENGTGPQEKQSRPIGSWKSLALSRRKREPMQKRNCMRSG